MRFSTLPRVCATLTAALSDIMARCIPTFAGLVALALGGLGATPARADVYMFRMPSGNVVCIVGFEYDSRHITCTIFERSGTPARPAPADCRSFWGHTFSMANTGPVEMVCTDFDSRQGKTVTEVVSYGETADFESIKCKSLESGLECRNSSGHGFKLSRRRQDVF